MKKLLLLVSLLFVFSAISTIATGQQGNAMLKIVKSEDGSVKVYDMQGNEIHSSQEKKEFKPGELINIADQKILQELQERKKSISTQQAMNPGPDLDAVLAYCSAGYNSSTHQLTVAVRVKNVGDTSCIWSYLGYYVSTNAAWSVADYRFGNDRIGMNADHYGNMDPGDYVDNAITVDISTVTTYPTLPCGTHTYYVGFIIDYTNRVAEDNEGNFWGWSSPSITFPRCGSGNPNLTMGQPTATYSYDNCSLTINVRVKNDGTGAANFSSTLGYYLSSDDYITTSDCKLGTDNVAALAAGAGNNESITISDICNISCVSNGTWYVGFILDENNNVSESNEYDNSYGFSETINVTCCGGGGCGLTVTSPNGGEVWDENTTHQITWNSSGTCASVKIKYTLDGVTWPMITEGTANDGSYSWTLPEVSATSTQCRIKIYCADNVSCADFNNYHFTIRNVPPGCSMTVTSPNGGEVWDEQTTHQITWSSSGSCANVKIEYSTNNGYSWTTITGSTSNDGSYPWTLPGVSSTQTNCLVRVSCTDGSCSDQSNGTCTISNVPPGCSMTVTSPNGGEVWDEQTTHQITWSSSGSCANVKIEYSTNNGYSWTTITGSTPNDGSHSWTLPSVSTTQTNCRVRVSCTDGSCTDQSNGTCTIQNSGGGGCSITVTSPNGGEVWDENSTHPITWNSSGTCSVVRIEYSTDNGASWHVLATVNNDGSWNWKLIYVDQIKTNCRVIVSCTDGSCSDQSDGTFTIQNSGGTGCIQILVPGCNVAWKKGEQHKISWIPANKSGKVKIEYRENTGTWETIIANTEDDGCFCWIVPPPYTRDAWARNADIRITDINDPNCTDMASFIHYTVLSMAGPYLIVDDIVNGTPGAEVTTFVRINGHDSAIDAFQFQLDYNTDHLEFVKAEKVGLISSWGFAQSNEPTSGQIIFNGIETDAAKIIPTGSNGELFKVYFKVKCNSCSECTQSHLVLRNLKNDFANIIAYCGTYSYEGCCECGDVNMDGEILPDDALCVLYFALQKDDPACNTECAMAAADVNGDGEILPDDALEILWYSLKGNQWRPGACGTPPALAKEEPHSYILKVEDVNGQPGDIVNIPIMVDNPTGIDAFMLELNYPVDLLEFVAVSKTGVTKDWIALAGTETEAGIITIGGFNPDPINISSRSAIAKVSFVVRQGADGDGVLNIGNLKCDLAVSSSTTASFSANSTQSTSSTTYELSQNYPNPFNNDTEIVYNLPATTNIKVTIYNISGQKIRTLVDGIMEAGSHNIRWNGKDDFGDTMASGIYIYKLETGNIVLSKKMILMK